MARPEHAKFCWIERRLDEKRAAALDAAQVEGVSFKTEYRRVYPLGSLAAHIIGFVGLDKEGDLYGMTGMEAVLDKTLRGVKGVRELVRDGARRTLLEEGRLEVPPIEGATVTLTIDPYVQQVCEEAVARAAEEWTPQGMAFVVLKPLDGRILALGSWPTYDPDTREGITPESLRDRAISDTFEPGSIMKPLTAGYAIQEHAISPTQHFDCSSPWTYRARHVTDVHNLGSDVPFMDVIAHSSNIGMSKIALALDGPKIVELLGKCGFGRKTGLGLPLEESGYTTPLDRWSYHSTISVAQGYELSVTPVQMASAFAALANGGVRMRPQLVERVEDAQGHVLRSFQPEAVERIVDAHVATDIMVPAMERVVEEGTAKSARLEKWTVAGKTGTAMKVVGRGYQRGHYRASFCGFAPAERPEVLVVVMTDDPHSRKPGVIPYGGTVSAPVVKEILEQILPHLRVPPSPPHALDEPREGHR
jgi:cell division protein FtsI/penicillin-binding protein 2